MALGYRSSTRLHRPQEGKRRIVIRRAFALIATLIAVVAALLAIWEYRQLHPSYDLTGEWILTDTVTYSEHAPYVGIQVEFRIFIVQEGRRLNGVGEKWTDDWGNVPVSGRVPIEIEGVIRGRKISATFIEKGLERETRGTFDWLLVDNDTLSGEFRSTAGYCIGTSNMKRIKAPAEGK